MPPTTPDTASITFVRPVACNGDPFADTLSPAISPTLRQTMAATYRELAEANALLGLHDLAARCERNAEALEFGGVIDLDAGGAP